MHCRRCRVKMREEKRSFHKKRKWICPKCGRARMQEPKRTRGRSGARRDKAPEHD